MRGRYLKLLCLFCFVFILIFGATLADCKNAVVITAFGSRKAEAVQSLDAFVEFISKERPDLTVRKAFSSYEILEKMDNESGKALSLPAVISQLHEEGYANIGMLSLHVTPGKGYRAFCDTVADLQNAFQDRVSIKVSSPLVGNKEDAFSLASYLIYSLPAEIKPGEVVVFVGNGSDTEGSLVYPALNWALFLQGEKGTLYLAISLEDRESINEAIQIIKLNRRKVVWMIPLMALNGVKADEAVFSTDDYSVASRFKDAGFTVRPYRQGLVGNPAVRGIWRSNLNKLLPPLALDEVQEQ